MVWRDIDFMQFESTIGGGRLEPIEMVGIHLRVSAQVDLGRFRRLSDLVNHTRGYLVLRDARLLTRNGEPTRMTMPELLLNQNEITFIGQRDPVEQPAIDPDDRTLMMERPSLEVRPRRLILFTAGHAITGSVFLYDQQTVSGFVDSPDPRFVPMTNARARSLADRRVISHFTLLLVNRTQMIAAAETARLQGSGRG